MLEQAIIFRRDHKSTGNNSKKQTNGIIRIYIKLLLNKGNNPQKTGNLLFEYELTNMINYLKEENENINNIK